MRKSPGSVVLAALLGTLACSGGSNSNGPVVPQQQVGTVSGRVTDGSGTGVAGAGLSLSATGKTTLSTSSAADGSFSFANVTVGSWTLGITPPTGFTAGTTSQAVSVVAGQTASANFALQAVVSQGGSASAGIVDFAFSPTTLTVAAGTTVTWTNNGAVTHTVTGAGFDSGNLASGATFSHTFSTPGTFSYSCSIHPSMTAKVVVQ